MKISERIQQLVHEGISRRVVVRHDGRTIAAAPLIVVVVGAVIAPPLAVAAGLVALLTHSNVTIEPVRNGAADAAGSATDMGSGSSIV